MTVWFCLVFPSLSVVHKYLHWWGLVAYALVAAVVTVLLTRLTWRPSERLLQLLAVATFLVLIVVLVVAYPIVNTHEPGKGSDDDDALNLGVAALLQGRSPYAERTYLGNVLHHFAGAFILAAPFALLSSSAWQNIFWLFLFFLAARVHAGDTRRALLLLWLLLGLSPVVLQQIVTGTGHFANALYVLQGLWWLTRTRHTDVAAVAWGVALASRANFLFLLPLAFAWLRQHRGWRAALQASALTVLTCAVLTLPFYWLDPTNFGPLEAVDRLTRFNHLIPHASDFLMGMMAVLAVTLSYRRMDANGCRLFGSAAIVQGFPVVTGLLLSSAQQHSPDLAYASYGTFFAPFALFALLAQPRPSPATGAA